MRTIRIAIGTLVTVCALGALAGSASAKEKLVFGEFEASLAGGKAPSPTEPGILKVSKEGEASLTGLELGNYKFGPVNRTTGEIEYEAPCLGPLKVGGDAIAEKSSSLLIELKFKKCVTRSQEGLIEEHFANFTLAVKLSSNFSAATGKSETGVEIEPAVVTIKGGLKKCLVQIPQQTIPAKLNPEKEYEEIVSFSPESEPVENWEKNVKLKERYPSGVKQRLDIELGEKFKGIHSFVDAQPPCAPKKGDENGKLITEKENPYFGWLEYTSGSIHAEIEGLEVKNGELTFVPSA